MSDCAVVWIRDDFRIKNNHALSYACKNHEAVTAIYIHNNEYFDGKREAQKWWISKSLESLSLIHISEPTRRRGISYAVFCLKKKIP